MRNRQLPTKKSCPPGLELDPKIWLAAGFLFFSFLAYQAGKSASPPLGGGTSIDFTEILGTFGFFPENKFFGHPNYENCNIYPKNGDCDPKKQFFGTLEQVFEKSQKVWTVWYLRGVKTKGVLGGLTKITSNSVH